MVGVARFELTTSCSQSRQGPDIGETDIGLAAPAGGACTAACTNWDERDKTLEALACALRALQPEDRVRHAALLSEEKCS